MAYTDEQKKQHILEVQQYLYAISMFDDRIPQILPSGKYDDETAEAVKVFQKIYGLPQTGETDPYTWDMIVKVYRDLVDTAPCPYPAFPSKNYICRMGDHGQLVYIIQAMLCGLCMAFDNMPETDVSGDFDDKTAEAVMAVQKRTGLPDNGEVDCPTWNMLVKLCAPHGSIRT
jgi:peptidoglycan hydrolase-like protein with peptidoglycan-binding domain